MSDFDDIFKEKLSEEEHFPHRNKNWQRLNKQLDAFGAGSGHLDPVAGGGATVLSGVMSVLSAILVVSIGILLWKNHTQQIEFQALNQKIVTLEQQVAQLPPPAPLGESIPVPNPPPHAAHTMAEEAESNPPATRNVAWAAKNQGNLHPLPDENAALAKRLAAAAAAPTAEQRSAASLTHQILAQSPSTAPSLLVPESSDKANNLPTITTQSAANPLVADLPNPANPNAPSNANALFDSLAQAPQPTPTAAFPDTATAIAKIPQILENPIDTLKKITPNPAVTRQIDSLRQTAPPIIKPLQPRLRVFAGIEAAAGKAVPHEAGISIIMGQGITAGVALWRSNFWLTGSGLWTRFEEDTDKFLPRFHRSGSSHGGGPHPHDDYKILKVESSQRQQRYQLGLRYQLPQLFRLRPSLHVGHVWTHTSSTFVSYLVQKINSPGGPGPGDPPNEPKFDVRKAPAESYDNIWSVGAGLDYERHAWTFGFKTEYQDYFGTSDHTFNTLWITAGLKYRLR